MSGLSELVAIADGTYYSIAVKSDGTVWAWGEKQLRPIGQRFRPRRTGVPLIGLDLDVPWHMGRPVRQFKMFERLRILDITLHTLCSQPTAWPHALSTAQTRCGRAISDCMAAR